MKLDKLLLENKVDIFINEIGEMIHQPSIKEIAFITQGEKRFFEIIDQVCRTIVDKELIDTHQEIAERDKMFLKNINSFEYFLALITQDFTLYYNFKLLLKLFFPDYICDIEDKVNKETGIYLKMTPEKKEKRPFKIDKSNYDIIINYIKMICCLKVESIEKEVMQQFNPINDAARKIAEKIAAGQKRREEIKNKQIKDEYYLAKMQNILRGTGKFSSSELENMSIYQLKNTYQRYGLYSTYEEQNLYKANGFEIEEFIDYTEEIN